MHTYRFSEFELDLHSSQLREYGTPVKLEQAEFDLLILLLRERGRTVARGDIIATLWPRDSIVDVESDLDKLMRELRRALGDDSKSPRFIESVPGHGYRFIAAVAGPPPKPRVVVKPHSPPAWPRAVIALLMLTIVGILAYFLEQAEMP